MTSLTSFTARVATLVAVSMGVGTLALTAGCERSTGEKIEDAAQDAGDAVKDAAEDAADAAADAMEKADDKVGELSGN